MARSCGRPTPGFCAEVSLSFDGKMSTLRRYQDEVEEVKQGIECGIRLGEFNEYEEGDVIECYKLEKIDQTL